MTLNKYQQAIELIREADGSVVPKLKKQIEKLKDACKRKDNRIKELRGKNFDEWRTSDEGQLRDMVSELERKNIKLEAELREINKAFDDLYRISDASKVYDAIMKRDKQDNAA